MDGKPASTDARFNTASSSGQFGGRLEFGSDATFETELRRRIDAYFLTTGRSKKGDWRMYLKTMVILATFAATYILLVFWAKTPWQGVPLAILFGFATAAIGFNIQHDGGHKSYSSRQWVNKLAAVSLDLIGGSSYVWRWKHAFIHHMYVNITDYDNDIDLGYLGRFAPHQPWRDYYRWQRFYLWPLYGILAIKWHFVDDFRNIISGHLGRHRLPRPKGWELALFISGKTVFITYALIIPMFYHRVWVVIAYYVLAAFVLGFFISVIFILPHCSGRADFPLPEKDTGRMKNPWAIHQASVTLDFERRSRIFTYLLGGLNFHLEHHLFPIICHIHYPAIAGIVEKTCREFGVKYEQHESFWGGMAAHYRWLREMGKADRQG